MSVRRLLAIALVATAIAGGLSACGSGGSGGAEITARFSRAVALYEGADVLVMGIAVGEVERIDIDGGGIDVTMRIDEEVPLPADATAAIVPNSLIGERTVVLGPAWREGDGRLENGDEIPVERTIIPVEPDEALESVTELLQSLDPRSVRRLIDEGANALDGNGASLGEALGELSQLIPYLAEQDDELLSLADDVGTLADVIRARDTQVGKLLRDFAVVSDALAEERQSIARFLRSLTSLTLQGEALLTEYRTELPEDMDTLASVALTVQANAGSVKQLLLSMREFQLGTIEAYDPETGSMRARVYTSQTLISPIAEILLALGVPPPGSGPNPPVPLPPLPLPDPGDVLTPPTILPVLPDPDGGGGDDGGLCLPFIDPGCEP